MDLVLQGHSSKGLMPPLYLHRRTSIEKPVVGLLGDINFFLILAVLLLLLVLPLCDVCGRLFFTQVKICCICKRNETSLLYLDLSFYSPFYSFFLKKFVP